MKRVISIVIAIVMVATFVTGCGTKTDNTNTPSTSVSSTTVVKSSVPSYMNESGYPIVKEKVTLKMMGPKNPTQGEHKDMELLKRMETLTGISFTYDTPLAAGYLERKNLAFASNDLPDVFYLGNITKTDEETYGTQGTLLALDKYIDQYAPNLKKVLDSNPSFRKAMTASDGHIYSLPYIVKTKTMAANIIYVNTEWLANVNTKMPTTTDEFYNVLKAFKDKDPNKNGKADEIPLSYWKQSPLVGIPNGVFLNAFSGQAGGANFDMKGDKVIYNPMEPYFKEYLTYMRKLFSEGLMDKETYTQTQQQYIAKFKEGTMGLSLISLSSVLTPGQKAPYELMPPLTSASNSKKVTNELNMLNTGALAITKNCKYPEAMMRWADLFFMKDDQNVEGINGLSHFLGIQGFNWKYSDATKKFYTRESKVEGLTPVDYIGKWVTQGGFGLVVTDAVPDADPFLLLKATESDKQYEPYKIPVYPSNVRFTKAESDRSSFLLNDVTTYVDSMMIKFIMGEESLDKWDTYLSTLKKMNIDELIKIYQDAYDRYNKTK